MNAWELALKLSELREALAVETDEAKAAEIRAQMATVEAEWRAAVTAEREERAAPDPDDTETRAAWDHPLARQVEMRNYLSAAASGNPACRARGGIERRSAHR